MSTISANGKHCLIDCLFCDKKQMRSDHFPEHFRSHINKAKTLNPIQFIHKYDGFKVVNGVLYKPCVSNSTGSSSGACYDCQKFIKNKSPGDLKEFKDHRCKKKQLQEKEIEQELDDEDEDLQEGNITLMKNQWLEIKNWVTASDDLAEYTRITNKNNTSIASNYLLLMRYLFKKRSTAAPDVSVQFNQIMAQLATLHAPAPTPAINIQEVPTIDYEKKLRDIQKKHEEEMAALRKEHSLSLNEYEEQLASLQQGAPDTSLLDMLRDELYTCKEEISEAQNTINGLRGELKTCKEDLEYSEQTLQSMIDNRKAEAEAIIGDTIKVMVKESKRHNGFKVPETKTY